MELINLTPYQPEDTISDIVYLRDEMGMDWYTSQVQFSAETLKICVDERQIITAANTDISTLWPIGMSIYEVLPINIPDGFSVNGEWGWNGEQIVSMVTIESAKVNKVAEIKSHRDMLTADYIIIDDHHFHSNASSRIQQLSLTKMGQAGQIPSGMMWQTKNHGLIELTNEIAAQFEAETLAHDMRLFTTAQQHIVAVEALENVQAVIDYDYSEGWQP